MLINIIQYYLYPARKHTLIYINIIYMYKFIISNYKYIIKDYYVNKRGVILIKITCRADDVVGGKNSFGVFLYISHAHE